MFFRFKSTLTDFLVDEQLPYTLLPEGSHFFVHIEKQGKTTMEIIDHLRRSLALPKNMIGYAGLKDKKGITRQWLSFDAEQMKTRMQVKYRPDILQKSLREVCSIGETGRYTKQLSLRDDFYNHFTVILRAEKKLSQNERTTIAEILTTLLQTPLANYFGTQRFGINGRNVKEAEAMLVGKRGDIVGFDRKFKLQALASHLFNMTLKTRIEKNATGLVDGDFVEIQGQEGLYIYHKGNLYLQSGHKEKEEFFVPGNIETDCRPCTKDMQLNVMLPMLGYNSLIPAQATDMGRYYHLFLRRQHITAESWQLYKDLEIFGIMRSAYISCITPVWKWVGDDLEMTFGLPAGAYASVVVDKLETSLNDAMEHTIKPAQTEESTKPKKRFSKNKVKKKGSNLTGKEGQKGYTASTKKAHRKGV